VFILYAIPIGILAGYAIGGRLEHLRQVRLRWVPVALIGLAVQVALFAAPFGSWPEGVVPLVYQASTLAVFVAVLRNVTIPGVALIAIGAGCNLLAVVANGGWMPADPEALASVGGLPTGPSNSIVLSNPVLEPLTDLFALPAWLPFANVFSVGDVLIGAGIAATIALGMRAPRPAAATETSVTETSVTETSGTGTSGTGTEAEEGSTEEAPI
jgi:hypothetical protein